MHGVFDDAYEYVLVFLQIQRLQWPQHTIFVNGVNLELHIHIVSRISTHAELICRMLRAEEVDSYDFDYNGQFDL